MATVVASHGENGLEKDFEIVKDVEDVLAADVESDAKKKKKKKKKKKPASQNDNGANEDNGQNGETALPDLGSLTVNTNGEVDAVTATK